MYRSKSLKIDISKEIGKVSALLIMPEKAHTLLVLSHGAGAGMNHIFMETLSQKLAGEGVGTLRFNFAYMENGGGPDRPKKAHPAIKAAVSSHSAPRPIKPCRNMTAGWLTSPRARIGQTGALAGFGCMCTLIPALGREPWPPAQPAG